MIRVASVPGASMLYAQITRANGTVGRRKLISYRHPNPLRRALVGLLIKLGAL